MLFPALFYLVMKVWIRIIFEILYFSLVLSLRCYLLMDIGVELEQWSSLLVPRRFCDQFARANFCSLELTVPGSEWPSSRSHNFWTVCRNLEFYIPLESSWSEESNGILILVIKGQERKWIIGSMKIRICLRVFYLILCLGNLKCCLASGAPTHHLSQHLVSKYTRINERP